jgi:hypothetical protein
LDIGVVYIVVRGLSPYSLKSYLVKCYVYSEVSDLGNTWSSPPIFVEYKRINNERFSKFSCKLGFPVAPFDVNVGLLVKVKTQVC